MNLKKSFLLSFIYLAIIGSLLHFTYAWSGNNPLMGIISATNESIFEHTKLVLYPIILWYLIYYLKHKEELNKNKWFTSGLISLITALIFMPMFFYFYNGSLGIESLILDLVDFFLSIIFGQLLGYHFYKYSKSNLKEPVYIILFLFILISYGYLTFNPLNIPLFITN